MLAPGNNRPPAQPADSVVRALVERRKALRLRQKDVAELMHVGQSAVCQFERGHDPHLSTLTRYARAVGVSVAVALDEIEPYPAGADVAEAS